MWSLLFLLYFNFVKICKIKRWIYKLCPVLFFWKKAYKWVFYLTLPNIFTCNFIKTETLAQVFSYEFCENFKNTYFYRTPVVAASGYFNHIWARQISTEFLFFCFIYSLENLLLILFSFFYLITTLLLDYFLLNSW